MIKKLIITLSILFFFQPLYSEVVNEIVIKGNKRVSDETIKIYGEGAKK